MRAARLGTPRRHCVPLPQWRRVRWLDRSLGGPRDSCAGEIFCAVSLPIIEKIWYKSRTGTWTSGASFEQRKYNVFGMSIAINPGGLLLFFPPCDGQSLKKLKMAMGGSCQELAWMWGRRRIPLGSAPQPRGVCAVWPWLEARALRPHRRSRMSRDLSRFQSRAFSLSRLSCSFLPRPSAMAILARPFALK